MERATNHTQKSRDEAEPRFHININVDLKRREPTEARNVAQHGWS
jgi:hypothetical protein